MPPEPRLHAEPQRGSCSVDDQRDPAPIATAPTLPSTYASLGDDNFYGGLTMVPRVGLDLGGRHLRVHPGIEASASFIRQRVGEPELAGMPALGIGFTTEVAYEW